MLFLWEENAAKKEMRADCDIRAHSTVCHLFIQLTIRCTRRRVAMGWDGWGHAAWWQIVTDEGDYAVVPQWRLEQLEAAQEEEAEDLADLKQAAPAAYRRKMQKNKQKSVLSAQKCYPIPLYTFRQLMSTRVPAHSHQSVVQPQSPARVPLHYYCGNR